MHTVKNPPVELPRFDGHLNFGGRPQKEGAHRGPSNEFICLSDLVNSLIARIFVYWMSGVSIGMSYGWINSDRV
jgi:hypothetical protein